MPSGQLLNYASSLNASLGARSVLINRNFAAVAELKAVSFARAIYRLTLVTSFTIADKTDGIWRDNDQTVNCLLMLGGFSDNASIIDYTPLGDMNTSEYVLPLLVPANTSLYFVWLNILEASATKATVNLQLVSI